MIIQGIQLLTTYNYDFIINERYYDLQLEPHFVTNITFVTQN